MMLHRGTMKMLSDLISPKALERLLSDGARERNTTLSALDLATLQDILKRDIYRRLQLSIPAALAKRRVQDVLDSLSQEQLQETVAGHNTQILTLEDQAKQFALYFDWPETQRLRAVLSVARQTSAEGRDAETLLLEGSELIENLERKLSEGLITQGQDLSELKASMSRLSGVGGPKIKRLDALIRQISEAHESRVLLPAEVERALALTLTLRKQVESSVVQQLGTDQQREMALSLNLSGPEEIQPFDLSLLPPEAQVRVQTLEREHEARQLTELARDSASLLHLNVAYEQEFQSLRTRSDGGEVLGESVLNSLRARLADARTEAIQAQQRQLATLAARLAGLRSDAAHSTDHGAASTADDAVQVARQGLSVAQQTLQGGALATDELAQLSELVRTLETGDSLARERLMALQRETFELERRAREVPGALGDLTPLIESARASLAAGQVTDLEPLWAILERRMGEAAQQRENMDVRAERVMQDYNRYRHLAGETIQKLGRLADVLRGQQRLGVLSSDARARYLQTLENAEALLTEAHAEFQAARDVTATFGADALSDLLGVFDPDVFDQQDGASDLLTTSRSDDTEHDATPDTGSPAAPGGEVVAADLSGGLSSSLSDDPFGLGPIDRPLGHPGSSLVLPSFETAQPFPVASSDFGQPDLGSADLQPAGHAGTGPLELVSGVVRSWLVEQGMVTQGDLSPAGDWRTETECEADVLRLAWLAAQAAELSPSRLGLETPGRSWLVTPQSTGGVLVVCAPDQQRASEAAGRWESRVVQRH
ncbi:hypothetical protein [Deinococcus altitudinis]|uniref:hypothetical protein n=1 Tax=Deinococcus altitudinis TaxID=468914 RepID=UPI00389220EB